MYVGRVNIFSKKEAEQRCFESWRHDMVCNEPMMKKGFTALQKGNWEEYKDTFRRKMKALEWACDRIQEAFEQERRQKR